MSQHFEMTQFSVVARTLLVSGSRTADRLDMKNVEFENIFMYLFTSSALDLCQFIFRDFDGLIFSAHRSRGSRNYL